MLNAQCLLRPGVAFPNNDVNKAYYITYKQIYIYIYVCTCSSFVQDVTDDDDDDGQSVTRIGRLVIVDLAGNERLEAAASGSSICAAP